MTSTTPAQHRSSSAPVKIDAAALLVLAVQARQSRIFFCVFSQATSSVKLFTAHEKSQRKHPRRDEYRIYPLILLPTNNESEELFPGAIGIEPEKQNNASPTVLAHAMRGQNADAGHEYFKSVLPPPLRVKES